VLRNKNNRQWWRPYGASIAQQSIISEPTKICTTSNIRSDDGASKGKNSNLNGALAQLIGFACQGRKEPSYKDMMLRAYESLLRWHTIRIVSKRNI
jgi:hypothetical protein